MRALWQYSLTLFNGEDHDVPSLVPSLFLDSSVNPDEYINDMLKWEKDLQCPKSLGSEVRRCLDALGACDRDSFLNIHFLLVVGCTLLISSAEAERSSP